MFDFFKPAREKARRDDPLPGHAPTHSLPSAPPIQPAEPPISGRELVRVVLRDTLRKHGIPVDWIGSQIVSRTQTGQPTSHQIQLVILKWHEGLLRFAPLLQQQLLLSLQQFDPHTDHSGHTVVWSFAPHCGCPYTTLPAPGYWGATGERQKFDLPPSGRKFHEVDDDFATTVPSAIG